MKPVSNDPFAWMRETIYEPKPLAFVPLAPRRPWSRPVAITLVIIALTVGGLLALSGVEVPQL